MRCLSIVGVMGFCTVVVAGSALADNPEEPAEPHWRLALETQLKAEQGCTLNEVLTVTEIPLGNDVGQDGRATCFDGREFTFARKARKQRFELVVCKPSVC